MKKLSFNHIKSTEPVAKTARIHSSFQLLPTNQNLATSHRWSVEGAGAAKANRMPVIRAKIQNFSYFAPAAKNVQLAGCFTHWQAQPINLRKQANGLWWTAVRLERGTYYYRFLVDGQWCDDPECPLVVPNPFGCMNAVRQVS